MNRLARTRYGPFSLGKVRAGGVSRLEIPKGFLKRLEEGSAAGARGGGGSRGRASPGPGVEKRRSDARFAGRASAQGRSGSVRGGGKGARIRKGVGAPTSRGDNASRRRSSRA